MIYMKDVSKLYPVGEKVWQRSATYPCTSPRENIRPLWGPAAPEKAP